MKEIKNWIKNESGEGYVGLMITLLVLMMLLSIFINVFPVFARQRDLNHFVKEVLRTAELSGRIDVEVEGEIARQKQVTGLNPEITFNTSGDVDLGEEITVTGKIEVDIGSAYFGSFSVPIQSTATGRSEVYHKNE